MNKNITPAELRELAIRATQEAAKQQQAARQQTITGITRNQAIAILNKTKPKKNRKATRKADRKALRKARRSTRKH
jgi:hypothetical protein